MRRRMPFGLGVIVLLTVASVASAQSRNFRAHCQGGNEVPPVDSQGQCQANFQQTKDGGGLHFRLNVANLESITQAHIHLADENNNGPVVAFLFGFVPEGNSTSGTLARGILTAGDLIGPLTGSTIEDLVAALESGGAYVNVHTQAHPPGEVRGQIH